MFVILKDKVTKLNKFIVFLNKRIIPIWLIALVLIVGGVGFVYGFKIVYAPELDNSWVAIDACGSWVSAIISGIAIWFAVNIPREIAREQNKIALFDKRFVCYNMFWKYLQFMQIDISHKTISQLRECFEVAFHVRDYDMFFDVFKSDESIMLSCLYLFDGICSDKMLQELMDSINDMAVAVFDIDNSKDIKKTLDKKIIEYQMPWKEFGEKHIGAMADFLKI